MNLLFGKDNTVVRAISKLAILMLAGASAMWAQAAGSGALAPRNNASVTSSTAAATATPATNGGDSKELEIAKKYIADYPKAAARGGIQGQVLVKVRISEAGDVVAAELISGDPILAESAMKASMKFKFKPFIKNGKAIKVTSTLPFDFFFTGTSAGAARIIHMVHPTYPPLAKTQRIEGTVVLEAVIGKDGKIKDLQPVSGEKILIPAALEAVQQWIYEPVLNMGSPIEVKTQITVNFFLTSTTPFIQH